MRFQAGGIEFCRGLSASLSRVLQSNIFLLTDMHIFCNNVHFPFLFCASLYLLFFSMMIFVHFCTFMFHFAFVIKKIETIMYISVRLNLFLKLNKI